MHAPDLVTLTYNGHTVLYMYSIHLAGAILITLISLCIRANGPHYKCTLITLDYSQVCYLPQTWTSDDHQTIVNNLCSCNDDDDKFCILCWNLFQWLEPLK